MSVEMKPINNTNGVGEIPSYVGPALLTETDAKTSAIGNNAINSINQSDNVSDLLGRTGAPVGRTWPQFGQLVASYLTFGVISAPALRAPVMEPVITVEEIPLETEEVNISERQESSPAPTFISRALESIKSFFTAIYNFLFA